MNLSMSGRRSLNRKLSFTAALTLALFLTFMGIIMGTVTQTKVAVLIDAKAATTGNLISSAMENEIVSTLRAYLRGKAEGALSVLTLLDVQLKQGKLSEEEAWQGLRELLKDPTFTNLGGSGFLAFFDRSGRIILHPEYSDLDMSSYGFIQSAMNEQGVYEEYEWQTENQEKGPHGGYFLYFKPWDVYIWADIPIEPWSIWLDHSVIEQNFKRYQGPGLEGIFVTDADGAIIFGEDRFNIENKGSAFQGLVSSDDKKYQINTIPIQAVGWSVTIVTDLTGYDQLVKMLVLVIGITVFLSSLLLAFYLRILMGHYLRPIKEMQFIVEQVSSGNLTGRATIGSDDEIGDVAAILNRVLDEFAGVIKNVRGVISILGGSIQNLSTSTQEIASTSNEQAASVKEVLSTMEDSDRLAKGVEVKVQEVARIANHTKENVDKGFQLIQVSLNKMDEIRSTNGETIAGIKILGDLIETIWDIVNIITGIADQTKIIAFNAELEAAAAGEAGKNFQIVAGEIRRLADSTVDSTTEIKLKINEIQHASDKLILASEDGTQRIKEGWEVSTNIRGVFEDVLRSSEVSVNSANEISRSMNMQVISFEQIFLTLKQISESIDNFVESTSYTSEVSDKLRSISESFKAQVDHYSIQREGEAR